jgi:hypothetical protein
VSAAAAAADRTVLSALVAFQQVVVYGYQNTLAKAPLTPAQRPPLQRFERETEVAAAALRAALRRAGGTPTPAPNPATAPPPADPSARGYLRDVITAEEDAVQSYYQAFQSLTDKRHIQGSAAFMAAAGRRLVELRKMAGEPLLPRAFETGGA